MVCCLHSHKLRYVSSYHSTPISTTKSRDTISSALQEQPQDRKLPLTAEFGASSIRENGISAVGCSQFLRSYKAYGGESIIWNVYANRVYALLLRSDLCKTEPWINTRSPNSQTKSSNKQAGKMLHTRLTCFQDVLSRGRCLSLRVLR